MKTYISKLLPVVFSVLIIASCSDSSTSPTTQNQSADSLMFSFDSLVYYSDSIAMGQSFARTVNNCSYKKFKVSCTFNTNDSSSNSYADIVLSNNYDTTTWHVRNRFGISINNFVVDETVDLNVQTPYQFDCNVNIGHNSIPRPLHKFILAKNFKLYKTN